VIPEKAAISLENWREKEVTKVYPYNFIIKIGDLRPGTVGFGKFQISRKP
jgi:hypothetical protein